MRLEEEIGKKVTLKVVRQAAFGVYLGEGEDVVLLPKAQVREGLSVGDSVAVFLYRDSSDRLIATVKEPALTRGETGVLEVAQTGPIGAFLSWGLEKDLLLPFKEQTRKVRKGDRVLVALYVDKSNRLCATMRVYDYLRTDAPYHKDEEVEGTVYELSDRLGAFVAVDDRYSALIPKREIYTDLSVGETVACRVAQVRSDGKLDLCLRKKAYLQMDDDAKMILARMEENGGFLPFTDQADPALIKKELGLSKKAFKRAVGRLLKEKKIQISEHRMDIR